MVQGIIIWLLTLFVSYLLIDLLHRNFPILNKQFALTLFFFHTFLTICYYVYVLTSPSDSLEYYRAVLEHHYGQSWFDNYGTSSAFVRFIAFFLVNYLGFSYESCMVFFSWLGYLGFLFFYIFFRERIKSAPTILGVDGIKLIFLLPNLHFWSASLGKGSLMFFAFGLLFFSLNRIGSRLVALIIGGWIIFQLRPHIFYVALVAIALGYTFSTKGVSIFYRVLILAVASFLLVYIYNDILTVTGLESESITDPLISHRARELSKATSGIDITNYSIPEKLFAFCFRPLFFDAPGFLGYIVSFENLFYLVFFLNLLRPKGLSYLVTSDAIVKTCFLTFAGVSFALAQISGNLGLAMRQKSQVMILLMFVILKFFDEQKIAQLKQISMRRKRAKQMAAQAEMAFPTNT
jgi:hypothetical protein